jgi:hypothetical protein
MSGKHRVSTCRDFGTAKGLEEPRQGALRCGPGNGQPISGERTRLTPTGRGRPGGGPVRDMAMGPPPTILGGRGRSIERRGIVLVLS